MNKISRGSHQGLLKNREETKRLNTEALWQQVQQLRKEKPNTHWSYKEVWQGRNLST
tara:strand:- start:30 stop:200 length:171 start_codon:yes stop_codon:yes gene_type:complete